MKIGASRHATTRAWKKYYGKRIILEGVLLAIYRTFV